MLALILSGLMGATAPEKFKPLKLPPGRYLTQAEVEKRIRGKAFADYGGTPHIYEADGKYLSRGGITRDIDYRYAINKGRVCEILKSSFINCFRIFLSRKNTIFFVYSEENGHYYRMRQVKYGRK